MSDKPITFEVTDLEKSEFCKLLKSKRLAKNIKQQHMADMLNIDVKTYRQIETCHKIANFETIQRLIRFLNDKEDMMMN